MAPRAARAEGSGRRTTLVPTEPAEALADLDLPALRAYRDQLEAEEERVSYWRRLVHARLDVLGAQARSGHQLTLAQLTRALGDTATGRVRRALVRVAPADPLPELPVLAEMWETTVGDGGPGDPEDPAGPTHRLSAAEQQLTAYRSALHRRLDEATGELILRYRANPRAALALIPMEQP